MPARPAYTLQSALASSTERGGARKGVGGSKGSDGPDRRNWMVAGFLMLASVALLWTLVTIRFFFPRVLREPPSKFKIGFPDAFVAEQVQTKFKARYGIWITNTLYNGHQQLVALRAVCTHLGCTPSWLEAEQKYKCACHGSGFYIDGINFEGPAPRPLERYAIRVADDGQVEIDKSQTFRQEIGEWEDPACYISV
jgi:cytochrome b6-f complex iron-sulfur subunit